MSNGLLVFIEHKGGTANRSSFEAIAAAQSLGSQLGQKVSAVVLGADVAGLAQEIAAYDVRKLSVRRIPSSRITRLMLMPTAWSRSSSRSIQTSFS